MTLRDLDRASAIAVLVDEAKRERQPNIREFRRLLWALRALGLGPAEQRLACRHLDIVRSDGRPWSSDLAAQVPWPVDGPRA